MPDQPRRILFICMGNICRSPAAEGVMKHVLAKRGLASLVEVDSAGTTGHHDGNPADVRMRATAKRRGYDLTSISRRVRPDDLRTFDLILCADHQNLTDIQSLDRQGKYGDKIALLLEYGGNAETDEVPDPYYGGPEGFEHVLDLLEGACERIADRFLGEAPSR